MTSIPHVPLLTLFTQQMTLYCPIFIITIGTIGCFCNFITFTSLKLRKTSCSLYFLGAAIFDLLTLDFGALTRLLADHWGYDPYNRSAIYCKIRQYFVTAFPAIATSFIVLAAMDRYMSTSSKTSYRSFATVERAKWIISFVLIICLLSYLHYPIFTDLRPTCSLEGGTYSIFSVVFSIAWTSIIPHFLMLCFGFGTHWHIRLSRRRIHASNIQQRRMQRTETQLVTMMLVQVSISSLLMLTRIAYFSYNVITTGEQKTDNEKVFDTFFSQLTTQLFYLNYAKSFYVCTLSSKYFRTVFVRRIRKMFNRFIRVPLITLTIRRQNSDERTNFELHKMHKQAIGRKTYRSSRT